MFTIVPFTRRGTGHGGGSGEVKRTEHKFVDVVPRTDATLRLSNPRGLNLYGIVRNNFQRCLFLDHGLPASRHTNWSGLRAYLCAPVCPRVVVSPCFDLLGCASLSGTATAFTDRADPPIFAWSRIPRFEQATRYRNSNGESMKGTLRCGFFL